MLAGFGGGTLAPILIGQPCILATNDTIIPLSILAWYLTHYMGFQSLFTLYPVRVIVHVFVALFRTHSVCNLVSKAASFLAPGNAFVK